jgi:thiol-disulfide isomerase/thioredoxin
MRSLVLLWILVQILASSSSAGEAPDAAWSRLQGLSDRANEKVPIGTNAVEFYSGREKALHDAAAEFVKQFPNDAHQPQAMLWKIQTTDYPDPAEQRVALLRQNERDAASIVDNVAWPANLRFQIQRTILAQWLDQPEVITTSGVAVEIEDRIADLVRKKPVEPLISFQLASVDLMLRFEPEKGIALLQELTQAPDEKLADAAKLRLLKEQMVGKPVNLQFTAVDGSTVDLQALRGKIVLVDFWATWCPDCLRDMPAIRQIYQKYKDKGFAVIGISLDKDAQALSNFVARKLIPWPQYFDGQGWGNDFATKYGVRAIPEMWLIDQRGDLVSTDVSAGKLDQKIDQLIRTGDQLSRN